MPTHAPRSGCRQAIWTTATPMYDDECATCAETFATFHITHDDLDPDTVSLALGIEPTERHRQGDVRNPRARRLVYWRSGGWSLRSSGIVESRDIRRHVD